MAALYVEELFVGRGGEDGIERKLRHTRVFEVRTDDPTDDETVAGAATGLPRNGDPHPNNDLAAMVRIVADNSTDDPTLWTVTCEYDTQLPGVQAREAVTYDPTSGSTIQGGGTGGGGGGGGGGGDPNPLERPDNPLDRQATYRIDWEQTTEICAEDEFGNPIVNSAGVPYDPPAQVEIAYAVITIEKNYPVGHWIMDLATQDEWANAVNTDEWRGIGSGKCRIIGLGVVFGFENGVSFGRVSIKIKVRRKGWVLKLVDCGYAQLPLEGSGSDKLREIIDERGNAPGQPTPLDGFGFELAAGEDLVYREHIIYPSKAYALLEL